MRKKTSIKLYELVWGKPLTTRFDRLSPDLHTYSCLTFCRFLACAVVSIGLSDVAYAQNTLPAPGSSGTAPAAVPSTALPISPKDLAPQDPIQGLPNPKAPPTQINSVQSQVIKEVRFVGNTVLTNLALQALVWPGQDGGPRAPTALSFTQMQALANDVTRYYREQGYLAAIALLPAQDLSSGILTIEVLEGQLDQVKVNADSQPVAQRIQEVIQGQVPQNAPLEQGSLERGVLLAGELTNQAVSAQLQAGTQKGSTSLIANATQLPKYTASVTVDNYGIPSTGQTRVTADVGVAGLITQGDRLALELGTTNDPNLSRRYDASYDIPVGTQGISGGVRAWQSNYALGGNFNALGATGLAQAQGVHLGYALLRSASAKADWRLGYNWINLSDQMQAASYINPRHTQAGWTDIGGWLDDQWLGTSAHTTWMGSLTLGNLVLDNRTRQLSDLASSGGINTQGQYSVWTYGVGREQAIANGFTAYGNARGQQSTQNLDGYYKFSLGGPSAVRAYPIGEVMGDNATVLTAELRYTSTWNLQDYSGYGRVALFYDWGHAQLNHTPLPFNANNNTAIRAGYGVGLDLGVGSTINARVYWAKCTDSLGYSQSTGNSALVGAQLTLGF